MVFVLFLFVGCLQLLAFGVAIIGLGLGYDLYVVFDMILLVLRFGVVCILVVFYFGGLGLVC